MYAARRLERKLPRHSARIVLVSDVNFLLYTPLLPGAASGSLEPRHVVVPLREELDWAEMVLGSVESADPGQSELQVRTVGGRDERLRYDHLIVCLGSVSRVLPVPGLAEHALGFKTLADAIALRNRALLHLEIAESLPDEESRREYLTFVFVGAGYAGLEGLAELQDFVADVMDRYPRSRLAGARFVLVEARDRVMPEIPPDLAAFASRELQRRGIEIMTGTTVEEVRADGVTLSTGERVATRTCAWTAGVRPHPVVGRLGLPIDGAGRIEVDSYMQVNGRDDVWAIGDAAAVPDPARKGQPCPPTSQHAVRQGKRVGENVAASLGTGRRRPFTYKTLGVFVDMGRFEAVASTVGIKWRGFPAWWLARTYHIAQLPGLSRKLRLVADSTIALAFPRDSAELGQIGHPPKLGELDDPDDFGEQATRPASDDDGRQERAGDGARDRAGERT